jgi:hypothetical protein
VLLRRWFITAYTVSSDIARSFGRVFKAIEPPIGGFLTNSARQEFLQSVVFQRQGRSSIYQGLYVSVLETRENKKKKKKKQKKNTVKGKKRHLDLS